MLTLRVHSWCRAQKTTQDSEKHFKDYSNLPPSKDDMRLMELQNELEDSKEKLRSMTSKFQATRKERDQLKQDNKEMQQEIISLQN